MNNTDNQKKELRGNFFLRNQRGITLLQVIIFMAIAIALQVTLNPIGAISKAFKGKSTTGFATQLTDLTQQIYSSSRYDDILYSTSLDNSAPPYHFKTSAPPVSAYKAVNEYVLEKAVAGVGNDRKLTYDANNQVKYVGTDSASMQLNDYRLNKGTSLTINGLSYAGSVGIAPFVNTDINNIENDLVLGLFNMSRSSLNNELVQNGQAVIDGKTITLQNLLELFVGDVSSYDKTNAATTRRWVEIQLVNSEAIGDILNVNSPLLDQNKYRLYSVKNIANRKNALDIAKDVLGVDTSDPAVKEKVEDMYKKMAETVKERQLIVIPNDDSDVVFSETSDYQRAKFSTTD